MYHEDGSQDFAAAVKHFEGEDYDEIREVAARDEEHTLEKWGLRAVAVVAAGAAALTLAIGANRQTASDKITDTQNSHLASQIDANKADTAARMGDVIIHTPEPTPTEQP